MRVLVFAPSWVGVMVILGIEMTVKRGKPGLLTRIRSGLN
jgi:hypothetical protein